MAPHGGAQCARVGPPPPPSFFFDSFLSNRWPRYLQRATGVGASRPSQDPSAPLAAPHLGNSIRLPRQVGAPVRNWKKMKKKSSTATLIFMIFLPMPFSIFHEVRKKEGLLRVQMVLRQRIPFPPPSTISKSIGRLSGLFPLVKTQPFVWRLWNAARPVYRSVP